MERNIYKIGKELFITSDEEIKEGDWFINFDLLGRLDTIYDPIHKCLKISNSTITSFEVQVEDEFTILKSFCKKITLTTDRDLIRDGVQAIDDEFLEWFVKNPICEEIEVKPLLSNNGRALFGYKIIIPSEERERGITITHKQETLEEAFEKWTEQQFQKGVGYDKFDVLRFGAKWQAEIMYSEEEVYDILIHHTVELFKREPITLEDFWNKFKKK